jgi:putative membrane protein
VSAHGFLLLATVVEPPALATADAVLNATATVLLVSGYVLIKRRREQAHKWAMLAALGVSIAFLTCYLTYHLTQAPVKFAGSGAIWWAYIVILVSHVILAATVPVLAIWTIVLGLKDRRAAHRKLAWWTFPIWLYVAVTGVVVYWMLYHLYPPGA